MLLHACRSGWGNPEYLEQFYQFAFEASLVKKPSIVLDDDEDTEQQLGENSGVTEEEMSLPEAHPNVQLLHGVLTKALQSPKEFHEVQLLLATDENKRWTSVISSLLENEKDLYESMTQVISLILRAER